MSTNYGELIKHEIFADNLILGKSLFLELHLPPEWQLAPGVGRPEVHSMHERRYRKYVAYGDAWYVLHDDDRRWAVEFAISIRSGQMKEPKSPGESASVAGHPARVRWTEKRRGLPWQRHNVTFMTMHFECPQTDRYLKLDFSGWCPEEGFREILQLMRFSRCH